MQHLPLLIIVIAITLACIKVVPFTFAWLAVMGTLTSWIYLRFYQKKEQDSRGDMSEGFAFATFFPEPIQSVDVLGVGIVRHSVVTGGRHKQYGGTMLSVDIVGIGGHNVGAVTRP